MKILLVIASIILPFTTPYWMSAVSVASQNSCYLHTTFVNDELTEIVVATGEWWFESTLSGGHGSYYGEITHYTPDGSIINTISTNRLFNYRGEIEGRYITNTIGEVTTLSADQLSDAYVERYVSPTLIGRRVVRGEFFRTPDGTVLFGLNNRPRLRCDKGSAGLNEAPPAEF